MRIRYDLIVASAVAFTLCLASPAEAAKKKKQKVSAAPNTSQSYASVHPWGSAGSGPLYNGQDYLGQDPDVNIRAYILKDLGLRYGGAF